MIAKYLGALLVVFGCTGFGFLLALSRRREEQLLQQLYNVLVFMESELTYRLTPLPDLCIAATRPAGTVLGQVLLQLAEQLQQQNAGDVALCMESVLSSYPELPRSSSHVLRQLGESLGIFDLSGQLRGLQLCQETCKNTLRSIRQHIQEQAKCYRLLGGCAGAALVILLL